MAEYDAAVSFTNARLAKIAEVPAVVNLIFVSSANFCVFFFGLVCLLKCKKSQKNK
jgi:hypothetical protein